MSIVRKAKTEPESFVQLYEQHVDKVFAYLVSRLRKVQEAEDICSRVWEIALNEIHSLKNEDLPSFQAWIFSISRNELNQHFRKQSHTLPLSEELAEQLPSEEATPQEFTENTLLKGQLHQLIESLSDQQQECVRLKYLADLKNKEIAKIQGVSEKTVASNLVRALKKLRSAMEKLQ